MIATGLDRLLAEPGRLAGRRFGLLSHAAAVSAGLTPAHLALARAGHAPAALFAAEHGYYAIEQDMVPTGDARDPWTEAPIRSLYGADAESLRPAAAAFAGLDLLLIDLQDVGARYYTFAATAMWAAEAALAAGCAVWLLDRPNPLGGEEIEGNLPAAGFASFVGAFRVPVRHGLTLGELVRLELRRRGRGAGLEVLAMTGWRRAMSWRDCGRPWIAPSPNMPTAETARVYPGLCLIEATELSEGRGTTRPFQLVGAPGIDALALAAELDSRHLTGVRFVPTFFRPQHQKHRGEECAGVEVVVTDEAAFRPYRCGVELLDAVRRVAPSRFAWRSAPYEFVTRQPAVDLLTGGDACRWAIEDGRGLAEWIATWPADEAAFRAERREILLYPETSA